ncbi:MAG: DUF2997 domain-containing protein [Anaerolineaceae bacterium]
MDLQEVEITIDKDGQVHAHVRGVKGQSCLEITRALEEALGGVVLSREMTPEALEQPNALDNPDELWLTGKM